MASEKHWSAIGPISFTSDGTDEGQIEILDTCGFYVKQSVILKSSASQRTDLEIKKIISNTKLIVGRRGHSINDCVDITAFLVIDSATITAPEQVYGKVPPTVIEQAGWAHEPINAKRKADVDCYGDYYTRKNPKPVTSGLTPEETLKCQIMSAHDARRDLTWAEIDGVRRIKKIIWTSVSVNQVLNQTISVTRDFLYLAVDPFDLNITTDTLDIM